MLSLLMKRQYLYALAAAVVLFGLGITQGCSSSDNTDATLSERADEATDGSFVTTESPIGFRISYPESWDIIKGSSSTLLSSRAVIFGPDGSISRVILPVVIFSARPEKAEPLQQSLQIIVGPRSIGGDGLITPEREFNFHLRILNLVKGKFLDKVQKDKDELPRFVSEIQSPSSLPGTDADTHIFDHFWVTDTATWQVTCATAHPPSEQAERICKEILDSFFLY
jgi:hypothetical protein